MKKKSIIAVILVIILITIGYFIISNKTDKEKLNTDLESIDASTSYDNNDVDEEVDFSNYEQYNINLNELSNEVKITNQGVYTLTGNLSGYIHVDSSNNIKIILNDVTITNNSGPCIYIENGKETYIELVGENNLTDGNTYNGFTDVDGCIYSSDDLYITGTGTLNINANYLDGIVSKDDLYLINGTYFITSNDDGIRGKDSVVITNGTYNINSNGDGIKSTNDTDTEKGYIIINNGTFSITSKLDGIQSETKLIIENGNFTITTNDGSSSKSSNSYNNWTSNTTSESSKGIKAGSNIVISNGTFIINSSDDSIHSNGSIGIKAGTYSISSGDDGIHADSSLIIDNGTIDITKSYEGLEGSLITINGGNIKVVSSDDGVNVAGGNDSSSMNRPGANNYTSSSKSTAILTINGGVLYVNSTGDGLDSNGSIIMTNGTVYVDGPTNSGNGALDYDSTFNISGGTIIAVGASGMSQGISSSSTQYGILANISNQAANTTIKLGNITYTPSKSYSSILISSSELEKGSSYDLLLNGTNYQTITISSILTTIGNNSMNGGGPGRR